MKSCGMCDMDMEPNEHPKGLVVAEEIFICEECAKKDNQFLINFAKEKGGNMRPIMLYLMEKDKK
ncbi:MAG: hypothetical protein ACQEP1_02285 [Nanobdellota archaeon]